MPTGVFVLLIHGTNQRSNHGDRHFAEFTNETMAADEVAAERGERLDEQHFARSEGRGLSSAEEDKSADHGVAGKDRPDQDLKWRPMSKSVADVARRMAVCRAANGRYLEAMAVIGPEQPAAAVLDPVSQPIRRKGQRASALRPIGPDDATLFAAVMDGRHVIDGLTNADLQAALFPISVVEPVEKRRRSNRVGRKLRLLRRHGLIHKIGRRRLYRVTDQGRHVMGLALAIRQSVTMLSNVG